MKIVGDISCENPGILLTQILGEIPGRIPVKILQEQSIKELLETFLQEHLAKSLNEGIPAVIPLQKLSEELVIMC